MTECKELQPSCAKGKTVGLFKTGKIELIASILSLGALSKMYFDCLARKTDWIRKRSLSIVAAAASETEGA